MIKPILVGAVVYDPKVVLIWDIIKDYFHRNGCPMDYVFYSNYELQVEAHLRGDFDIAWNSPLAWVDMVRRTNGSCRAIAMRDTDRDRMSHIVARSDSGMASLQDLRGRNLGCGARDSPQATLIPKGTLSKEGLVSGKDYAVRCFDVLVGKHGDHIGGELDAFEALKQGDVAASVMLDLNWEAWCADGRIDPKRHTILASTPRFDHCVFTVKEDFAPEREQNWLKVLFSMDYTNPDHREMMDMEGLRTWETGRTSGFGPLIRAVDEQDFFARRDAGQLTETT